MNTVCNTCGKEVEPGAIFCSQCGVRLQDTIAPVPTSRRITIYLISFLLAPMGLYWFFKFYKDENPYKKTVARNVLLITIIALAVMIFTGLYAVKMYDNFLDNNFPDTNLYRL